MRDHQQGVCNDAQNVEEAKLLLTQTLSSLIPSNPPSRLSGDGMDSLPRSRHITPQNNLTSRTSSSMNSHQDDVPLVLQPYRTTPLVLPHAKTIHDVGNPNTKFIASVQEPQTGQPYRNATMAMPGPKTINEIFVGGPTYQPQRGPQYNSGGSIGRPNVIKATPAQIYNSPAQLYSEEAKTEAAQHPGFVQASQQKLPTNKDATLSKPHESETFKMILEAEMGSMKNQAGVMGRRFSKDLDRPNSQLSDRSEKSRHSQDPVMKDNTINQSASFKKVMYSVLGETEF